MAEFKYFTPEERNRARETDLVSLLLRQGETVKRAGSEFAWMDRGQKVSVRGYLWYHQYEQVGGDAIDFVCRYYEKTYPEAVQFLLDNVTGILKRSAGIPVMGERYLRLPEACENERRALTYLQRRRGIDRNVVYAFAAERMTYESAKTHNVVFVGYDSVGNPRHASMRGTGTRKTYKSNAAGSVAEYSFHWNGRGERLFLFEAPIDMLSFISMNLDGWKSNCYAACCGVGDRVVFQMMKDNPNIKEVVLCLDNDDAGRTAAERMTEKLKIWDMKTRTLVPIHKDWNEDLLYNRGLEVAR